MEEVKETIKGIVKDRFDNPFITKLIIAWTIINWRIIFIAIFESKETLGISKLDFINEYISKNTFDFYFLPFIIASIIFLFDYFPKKLDEMLKEFWFWAFNKIIAFFQQNRFYSFTEHKQIINNLKNENKEFVLNLEKVIESKNSDIKQKHQENISIKSFVKQLIQFVEENPTINLNELLSFEKKISTIKYKTSFDELLKLSQADKHVEIHQLPFELREMYILLQENGFIDGKSFAERPTHPVIISGKIKLTHKARFLIFLNSNKRFFVNPYNL